MEEEYLEGYGEEIVPFDDVGDDEDLIGEDDDDDDVEGDEDDLIGDEIDDVLEALSGDDDDDDDEVGAFNLGKLLRRMRKKVRRRKRGRRKRRRRSRRGYTRRLRARKWRQYPLGLGTTAVAAGATAVININPQLPFKLTRLSTGVAGMTIDNVQIGTVSQFVAAGGIPTEVFGPAATGVNLKGDTCVPGVSIQLTVTNPTAGALNFTGALFGMVAQ